LQEEKRDKTTDSNQKNQTTTVRRKRVNRIKTMIIIGIIILLVLPTIICIILGFKVNRLQKQVDILLSTKGYTTEAAQKIDKKEGIYAYASELPDTASNQEQRNNNSANSTDDNQSVSNIPIISLIIPPIATPGLESDLLPGLTNVISPTAFPTMEGGNTAAVTEKPVISQGASVTQAPNATPAVKKTDSKAKTSKVKKTKAKKSKDYKISSLNTSASEGKKVYLTFDDGPSVYTDDILDILAKYHVKATFFVVGKTDENSKRLYKRIVNEGHTLGMHSYSHVYKNIYNSVEDFDKDFTKLWKLLYDTTGYKPTMYRFPGGSANQVNEHGMSEFIKYLNEKSFVYFDWNVENGDATGVVYTKEQLIDNVIKGVEQKERSIVLMHDGMSKKTTVESLPGLIETLLSEGVQILPLDENVPPIQQIRADTVE